MKTILLIAACFSFSLFAQVERTPLLSQWSLVMEGFKDGNQVRSLERKITTPYSRYTVAQVTMMDLSFEGDQSLESTRSFLSKEFKLTGLQEKSLGKSHRFEGYRADLRRQVVVFVSFSEKRIRVSTSFYRPAYGNKIALETELLHRKYHEVNDRTSFSKYLKLSLPFIESAYAATDCALCSGNPTCLMLCQSASPQAPTTSAGNSTMSLTDITTQLQATNSGVSALSNPTGLLGGATEAITNVGTNATEAISNAGGSVSLSISDAGISASTSINSAGNNVSTSIDTAGTKVSTSISSAGDSVSTSINSAGDNLSNSLNTAGDKVSTSINSAGDKVNSAIDSGSTKLAGAIDSAGTKASTAISDGANKVSGSMDKLSDTIDAKADKGIAAIDQTNKRLADLTNSINNSADKVSASAEKANANWAKTNEIAEKMADPNHLFKLAAFTAAGAVIGSTVANLAISGVSNAIGFLVKWATGELKTMKQEEILKEFNEAMKVYGDSSQIAKKLEISIDGVLNSMALHDKFKLDNSDIMTHIQKVIIETQFDIDDATKNRCVEDLIGFNQNMVEYQSLAKILSMANPQKKMCTDLAEMFRKLAEIEGVLQNARPNLLKAEEALNWQKARSQNKGAKTLAKIREGDLAREVRKTQEKQRRKLYKQNLKDTRELAETLQDDCRDSFKDLSTKPDKNVVRAYCASLLENKENAKSVPGLSLEDEAQVLKQFKKKYISLSLDKVSAYDQEREALFESFDKEMDRHEEESMNMVGKLQMDPRIALDEMKAVNQFAENLMKEQAYIYTDGLKAKKAKFDEACHALED
jgi:hypothetical protein